MMACRAWIFLLWWIMGRVWEYGEIEGVGVWGPRWDCGRCRVVGTNTVYLSQAINLLAGCNFKTLVNRYRVEHICQEAERTNRDVEDIANDYRFWSRSTFYDAFKTHTGKTPRQYMDAREKEHGKHDNSVNQIQKRMN